MSFPKDSAFGGGIPDWAPDSWKETAEAMAQTKEVKSSLDRNQIVLDIEDALANIDGGALDDAVDILERTLEDVRRTL